MAVLIGIDMGTTHTKMAAYDSSGTMLHMVRHRTDVHEPGPGLAEYDAHRMWHGVADGLRQLVDALGTRGRDVKGIGVAGMAEAGLLLSRAGDPLTPVYSWYDERARHYVSQWERGARSDELFRTTGLEPSAKCPLIKLQWVKDREPAAFEKGWKWLHVPDYIVYRLTGEAATDASLASRTCAYDIHRGVWCEWIIESAGLRADLFPIVVEGTTPVGTVTGDVAANTGLPTGVPVVVAGHDHVTGAAGVGCLDDGDIVDSMGTAESLVTVRQRILRADMRKEGYGYGRHVAGGKQYILGGFSGSGASVEWAIDRLGGPEGADRYDWVLALLEKVADGPTGLLYLPYLRGNAPPKKDRGATAMFFGITEHIDDATWLKAVIEGLACEFRRVLDDLSPRGDRPVTVIGGGVRNPLWMQLKADITGRRLIVPDVSEAVSQGAAMLAGVAAVVYNNAKEGAAQMAGSRRVIEPDGAYHDRYHHWYTEMYLPAVKAARDLQRRLNGFR